MVKNPPKSLIFVDGTNLDHRLLEAFGRNDVHFDRFFRALSNGTSLVQVYYCTAPYFKSAGPKKYAKQMADLNALRSMMDVTVDLGRYKKRSTTCRKCSNEYPTFSEKGTDVYVASRMVRAACHKHAERLVLVSNDNDYWPAVETCRQEGAEVVVAIVVDPVNRKASLQKIARLRSASSSTVEIDGKFIGPCWR